MKSLAAALNHKWLFLTGTVAAWFEVAAIPNPMLLLFLFGAMVVDFVTGLVKSWGKGLATSSSGFRKTVQKVVVYTAAILGMWFLANLMSMMYKQTVVDYSILVNGSIGFITFIEIFSIFENIYEISPNNHFSKYFVRYVLKFLKGRLEKDHPLKQFDDGNENLTDKH